MFITKEDNCSHSLYYAMCILGDVITFYKHKYDAFQVSLLCFVKRVNGSPVNTILVIILYEHIHVAFQVFVTKEDNGPYESLLHNAYLVGVISLCV